LWNCELLLRVTTAGCNSMLTELRHCAAYVAKTSPCYDVFRSHVYGRTRLEYLNSLLELLIVYVGIVPVLHCMHHKTCRPILLSNDSLKIYVTLVLLSHSVFVLGVHYYQQILAMFCLKAESEYEQLPADTRAAYWMNDRYLKCKWGLMWNTMLLLLLTFAQVIPVCFSTIYVSYVCVLVPLHFTNFFLAKWNQ